MAEPNVINLKYPIVVTRGTIEVKIEKLTMPERLQLKHLRYLGSDSMGDEGKFSPAALAPLIAGMTNISIKEAEEIDFRDIDVFKEILSDFLA